MSEDRETQVLQALLEAECALVVACREVDVTKGTAEHPFALDRARQAFLAVNAARTSVRVLAQELA